MLDGDGDKKRDGNDGLEGRAVQPNTIVRKMDSVTWKKDSFVANAFNVGPDGRMGHMKITEYKIDRNLIGLSAERRDHFCLAK